MRGRQRSQQRQENRQVFGRGGTATRYKMREKLISCGNDFWIQGEKGWHIGIALEPVPFAGIAFLRFSGGIDAIRHHCYL